LNSVFPKGLRLLSVRSGRDDLAMLPSVHKRTSVLGSVGQLYDSLSLHVAIVELALKNSAVGDNVLALSVSCGVSEVTTILVFIRIDVEAFALNAVSHEISLVGTARVENPFSLSVLEVALPVS